MRVTKPHPVGLRAFSEFDGPPVPCTLENVRKLMEKLRAKPAPEKVTYVLTWDEYQYMFERHAWFRAMAGHPDQKP